MYYSKHLWYNYTAKKYGEDTVGENPGAKKFFLEKMKVYSKVHCITVNVYGIIILLRNMEKNTVGENPGVKKFFFRKNESLQ